MKKPFAMTFGLFALVLIAGAGPATAQTYRTAAQSRVEFEAVGRPSLLKIKGHGARLVGELRISETDANGKFQVLMEGFTTDIDLRDRHMKEKYLMTKEHPRSTLDISSVALPKGWKPGQPLSTGFKGELTLKGVKKPIEGAFKTEGANMKTEASFTVKLSDFGIEVPKYMGITVADTVTVKAAIPAFGIPKAK